MLWNLHYCHVIIFYLPYEDHLIQNNIWTDKFMIFNATGKNVLYSEFLQNLWDEFFILDYFAVWTIWIENFHILAITFSHIEFFSVTTSNGLKSRNKLFLWKKMVKNFFQVYFRFSNRYKFWTIDRRPLKPGWFLVSGPISIIWQVGAKFGGRVC